MPLGTIKSRMFAGLDAPARASRRRSRGRIMEAEIHELTAGYALDALDPAEREAFEAPSRRLRAVPRGARLVLGGHERARRRRRRPCAERRRCASGSSPTRARRRRPSSRSTSRRRVSPVLAAAGRDRGSRRDRARDLRRLARQRPRRHAGRALRAGAAPRAVLADPDGDDGRAAAGTGRLVVARDGDAVLVLDDLAAAPAGKTYQAWVVDGRTPVSAGPSTRRRRQAIVPIAQPVPTARSSR